MPSENRDRFLAIRLNATEYNKVKETADKQGVSISELCRKLILERIESVKDYVKKSTFGKVSQLKELKEKIKDLHEYIT